MAEDPKVRAARQASLRDRNDSLRDSRMDQLQHGTVSTYNNHRCHCKECSEAARAYQLEYQRKLKSGEAPKKGRR